MKRFAREEDCMSEHIYRKLLGHRVDDALFLWPNLPKELNAPNLPELNISQRQAVKHALTRPLSLIQVGIQSQGVRLICRARPAPARRSHRPRSSTTCARRGRR